MFVSVEKVWYLYIFKLTIKMPKVQYKKWYSTSKTIYHLTYTTHLNQNLGVSYKAGYTVC